MDTTPQGPQGPDDAPDDLSAGAREGAEQNGDTADGAVHFLDDLVPGMRFHSTTRIRIEPDRLSSFAAEFDPQPFHLDDSSARTSMFGGIAASGWHTAAATMRLLVDSELKPAGGVIGVGFDELRWPRPVRPGDELHLETEVLEVHPSTTRPERGVARIRTTTLNQHDEVVQISLGSIVVQRRHSPNT